MYSLFVLAEDPVASFSVYEFDAAYEPNDVIRFSRILYNDGRHYNDLTGIFECPTHGIYMLHFSIRARTFLRVHLMKEGEVLVSAVGPASFQMSNLVFDECFPGQTMWLEADSYGDTIGSDEYRTITFSGALLEAL